MKISKYGVTLNRLSLENLEFLRQKFNTSGETSLLDTPDEITPDMQKEWFDNINTLTNFYFIIEYKGVKSGVLNVTNINWEASTSEHEIQIWEESDQESMLSLLAYICLLEVEFYYLNWTSSSIKLNKDDKKSIDLIKKLGYTLSENQENADQQLYSLNRESFETKGKQVQEEAQKFIEEESGEGFMLLEPIDYESGIGSKIENHIIEAGIYLHRRGLSGSRKYFR
jgi:hypothetical protein